MCSAVLLQEEQIRHFVENILPALVERKIKTVVDRIYSWSQIGEAHERMEANQNAGKIICTVD